MYFTYAKDMPIFDYHCHLPEKQILENAEFNDIFEIWLKGDHYKWRLMRNYGIDEEYITGRADEYEKFKAFASIMPNLIGNPMYHWCHLELKKYFGYEGVLNGETAGEVWDLCEKKLTEGCQALGIPHEDNSILYLILGIFGLVMGVMIIWVTYGPMAEMLDEIYKELENIEGIDFKVLKSKSSPFLFFAFKS